MDPKRTCVSERLEYVFQIHMCSVIMVANVRVGNPSQLGPKRQGFLRVGLFLPHRN